MNTVIYYPRLYPEYSWLKIAALCWDEVYTLVPQYMPNMPDNLQRLNHVLGNILKQSRIDNIAGSEFIKSQFRSWVESRKSIYHSDTAASQHHPLVGVLDIKFTEDYYYKVLEENGLVQLEWIDKDQTWMYQNLIPVPPFEGMALPPAYFGYSGRVENGEYKSPEQLAKEANAYNYCQVLLPKDIASHFFTLCASYEAATNKRDMLASKDCLLDPLFYDVEMMRGDVSYALVDLVVPDYCSNEKIREIRDELSPKRLAYQNEIQSLCSKLENVSSAGQLSNLKAQAIELATTRMDETKSIYRNAKITTITKSLGYSLVPSALASSLSSILNIGLFEPAAILASFSLFTASQLIEKEKHDKELKSNPWSYVIELERRLK